ncbi:MAG: O-antigen ligase family protein [Bryobacteraceae bacterium]
MSSTRSLLSRAAYWAAFGSAAAIVFSIAVSNILLVLALILLLVSGERLRLPPIRWQLGLFFLGTLISLLASVQPSLANPQIRKFFCFLTLLTVFSTFRGLKDAHLLVAVWSVLATASAILSFVQFSNKMAAASRLGQNFYEYYVGERTTGFMSHWMTFGGQEMTVLLLLTGLLFFAALSTRLRIACGAMAVVMAVGIALGLTRSIWLGTAGGGVYLLWHWKRWLILTAPIVVGVIFLVAPSSVRERLVSAFRPHGEVDSNMHRVVTWRTGLEMIKAHPLLGLGPEQVNRQFKKYVPADLPQPLPTGWYGHLHNIYLHYAAERGIPTMLMLVWMLVTIIWDFARAAARLPPASDARFFLFGAVAAVIAIMITGLFELNLGDSEVLIMFLATVACGYTVVEEASAEGKVVNA